jgi:hypothetical protein
MKKLLALTVMLGLGGCATYAPPRQRLVTVPKVQPAPTVTIVPAAPVPPATFKMRWKNRIGAVGAHVRTHFFHHHQ